MNNSGMTPQTILFDLDLTLCQPRCAPDKLVAEAFDRANVNQYCTAADLSTVESESLAADANSELDYYRLCFEATAQQTGVDSEDALGVARAYQAIGGHSDVEFLPGAETILSDLKEGYSLGLVTNGLQEIQQQKVNTLGIDGVFDAVVFATPEIGYKPDPAPFRRALSALETAPENALHIGDSYATDVAGAHAIGTDSIWIPSAPSDEGQADTVPEPDRVFNSLCDLREVL
ncbi:HAD family hydrolase [Haloterrigena salina]|nr:HAD family hydrolase [Haloterrigena salina]